MRQLLVAAAAAVVGAGMALLVGEYDLTTWNGPLAGAVIGLAVAEVVRAGRRAGERAVTDTVVAAVLAVAATAWAVWISTNRGRNPAGALGWLAVVVAAFAAVARLRTAAPRAPRSRPPA